MGYAGTERVEVSIMIIINAMSGSCVNMCAMPKDDLLE